jgi:hypothetical protein
MVTKIIFLVVRSYLTRILSSFFFNRRNDKTIINLQTQVEEPGSTPFMTLGLTILILFFGLTRTCGQNLSVLNTIQLFRNIYFDWSTSMWQPEFYKKLSFIHQSNFILDSLFLFSGFSLYHITFANYLI